MVALTALATLVVPLLCGAALGLFVRRVRGGRVSGAAFALSALIGPLAASTAAFALRPLLGIWDAAWTGLLAGVGLLLTAHAALVDRRRVAALALGTVLALAVLEVAARLLLTPPPRFPSGAGPHLWLADSIRASRLTQTWDMRSRELACAIIYGTAYRGLIDMVDEQRRGDSPAADAGSDDSDVRTPARYTPRRDVPRRELHVGDSIVFGLGVARAAAFPSLLGALEPDTEHVNAGVPALAPDGYLGVLQAWQRRAHFDVVTMYVFAPNDVGDLDGPAPCCGFAPLLTYAGDRARLRCAEPLPADLGRAGFEWLRYNSPPPYIVRALVDHSALAAHVGAYLVDLGHRSSLSSRFSAAERLRHLGIILRTARDELAARGTVFRLVLFPGDVRAAGGSDNTAREHDQIVALARELGVPLLDATALLRTAAGERRDLFLRPFDPHFNAAGHRAVAEWLHGAWAAPPDGAGEHAPR